MRRALPLVLTLCLAAPAAANDKAAAESLYEQGKTLLRDGNYKEACPKFQASHEADPSVGALLHLADCQEKLGQTASAWASFREAKALAAQLKQDGRVQIAEERAKALEARLSRLTIDVKAPPPGLLVKRNGTAVPVAALGAAVPVDPGDYTIELAAPGKKPATQQVTVRPGAPATVVFPPLEDAGGSTAPLPSSSAPPAVTTTAGPPPTSTAPPKADASSRRTAGLVLGGVGVVGLGVGAVFGLRTLSKWDASKDHCVDTRCDSEGASLASDAKSAGNVSTVAFALGAAALGVGGYLYFSSNAAVQLGTNGRGGFVGFGGSY